MRIVHEKLLEVPLLAKYIANANIDVIDLGVPVLSMHAPWEVVAKNDVFMTHKAIRAFYR